MQILNIYSVMVLLKIIASFAATQNLSMLPISGNSLILWVWGRSRKLPTPTENWKKADIFHSIAWQPGLWSVCWAQPFRCLHLEFSFWSKWHKDRGMPEMVTATQSGCLAAVVPTTSHSQTDPEARLGYVLSCPVYLGSCPFFTPGSLAFLLIL